MLVIRHGVNKSRRIGPVIWIFGEYQGRYDVTCVLQLLHGKTHLSCLVDGLAYLRDSCATLSALTAAHHPLADTLSSCAQTMLMTLIKTNSRLIPAAVGVWSKMREQSPKQQIALQVSIYCISSPFTTLMIAPCLHYVADRQLC